MKRKYLAVGIILLFVGKIIIPTTAQDTEKPSLPTFNGKWLYVGGTGPNNYTTIQDAINDVVDGDTVFVYKGTYYEGNIFITKSRINIVGEDKNSTIIDGTNNNQYYILRLRADGISISGFTIQHEYPENHHEGIGIDITHPTGLDVLRNIKIHDNIINGNNDGIWIGKTSDSKIYKNVISDNEYGITISLCKNCSIFNNNISKNNIGIDLITEDIDGRDILIYSNQFIKNDNGINAISGAIISENNFIYNIDHAYGFESRTISDSFSRFIFKTKWNANYWNDLYNGKPKLIMGVLIIYINIFPFPFSIPLGFIPVIAFDWHPAQKPYNIPG